MSLELDLVVIEKINGGVRGIGRYYSTEIIDSVEDDLVRPGGLILNEDQYPGYAISPPEEINFL